MSDGARVAIKGPATSTRDSVVSARRPMVTGAGASPHSQIVALQRAAGNRAVLRLRYAGLPPGDGVGQSGAVLAQSLGSSLASLAGGGRPLADPDRTYFESRFRSDLSNVRVHTGGRAEELAEALHARAFAVGSDVAFGRGQYAPETLAGKRLLGHELAHVVQAAGGTPRPGTAARSGVPRSSAPAPPAVSRRVDLAERQAEQAADGLSRGDASLVPLDPVSPGVLHRAEPDDGPSAPPVELPPVDVSSPEALALAERTAEEINATVARDWEAVRSGTGLDALLLAVDVEDILRDTFEMGHGAGEQLNEADVPALQS